MPRPPILPLIDWEKIFERGREYNDWLAAAESAEQREKMQKERERIVITPAEEVWLKALPKPVHVIAIAEDWCGDVVRNTPVLGLFAEKAKNLKERFIAREDAPDVFARFLTNGGEAIPKFIFLSDKFVECGNWGPMPDACRKLISRGKGLGDVGLARKRVAAFYEADEHRREVVRELIELIDIASTTVL